MMNKEKNRRMKKGREKNRILRRFLKNKPAMIGTVLFLLIFLVVQLGPLLYPIDLSYSESTQANVPPGKSLLLIPKEWNGTVAKISVAPTFHVLLSKDGRVSVLGHGKVAGAEDVSRIPEEVTGTRITEAAAGYDHIVALSESGEVFVWGNTRLQQGDIPKELSGAGDIVQLAAGNQCSAAVTKDGRAFLWGNGNLCDIRIKKEYQGRIKKIAFTGFAYIALLDDGTVAYPGRKDTAISRVPEILQNRTVVDITGTAQTAAAVLDDGSVIIWGNLGKGELTIPAEIKKRGFTVTEMNSAEGTAYRVSSDREKLVELSSGRYHYSGLTDDGLIVSFGADTLSQTKLPERMKERKFTSIQSGGYQNFVLTEQGTVEAFGHSGYLFGTDELGRDVFFRMLSGGRMTMTVGAVAVIISTALGILIGGISGYFGGKTDLFLQRFAEIISSLPFLPFAMILSSIIGSSISENKRIVLIMVVLGVLSWTGLSRLVRAKVLSEREKEFVLAAKAIGVKESRIVFRHIIPNVISIILVSATLDFATCMLTESSLSYLGFGVLPPQPTWGNMLSGVNSSTVLQNAWWRFLFPAMIFGICTICINLIGDGLRDAVDPKSENR